jgi:hypothetical protein
VLKGTVMPDLIRHQAINELTLSIPGFLFLSNRFSSFCASFSIVFPFGLQDGYPGKLQTKQAYYN